MSSVVLLNKILFGCDDNNKSIVTMIDGNNSVSMFVIFIALFTSLSIPVEAQSFKSLRYNEDYTYFKNDSISRRGINKIKFIPIDKKKDIYASLGGEIRWQYNLFRNEDWGELEADKNGFLLMRHMLHADVKIKKHLRVFTQLKANFETGRANGPRIPTDEDQLSLHQLFADLSINITTDQDLILRVGRQEFLYGSQRLVSVREGPNNRQSFDAAKIIFRKRNFQTDLFYANQVTTNPGTWDDKRRKDIDFFGAYAVANKVPIINNIDFYFLGIEKQSTIFNEGVSKEERYSIGSRIWNQNAKWMYDIEALYQFGNFGNGRINAWTASVNASRIFNTCKWKPALGIKAEIISGDRIKGDGQLQTFNPLFPRGAYFGLAALIGPANLMDIHPYFSLDFSEKISFNTDYDFFWRQSLNDGLYGPAGNFLRGDNNSRSRFIGQQIIAQLEVQFNKHFYFAPEGGYFITGAYLNESGAGKNMFLFALTSTFKF